MSTYNILIVEDEEEIARAIEVYLRNQNYHVLRASNGLEALNLFSKETIHLILMDIMMPLLDGIQTTIKIRETSIIPIIMLSAKSEEMDKVWGLNIGADDYITKPFSPMELIARVQSHLRRSTSYMTSFPQDSNILSIGGITLNNDSKTVYVDGDPIKLTPLEYGILHLLMQNPNKVFSIEEIYSRVWQAPVYNADTVTVHIRRIREKIEINPKEPKYLKVVWGIGYKFEK